MATEQVGFTPDELCAIVQGVRADLCNRLYWVLAPAHPIRAEDFDDQTKVISDMANAYTKAMMAARDSEFIVDEFKDYFVLSDRVYDLLDEIYRANDWDDIKPHFHNSPLSCELCEELITAV